MQREDHINNIIVLIETIKENTIGVPKKERITETFFKLSKATLCLGKYNLDIW